MGTLDSASALATGLPLTHPLGRRRRNKSIKPAPQRWQLLPVITFDVVMTFEQWLMDVLLDNMASRAPATNRPLLVINIDVKDSPTEAKKAGQEALQLCQVPSLHVRNPFGVDSHPPRHVQHPSPSHSPRPRRRWKLPVTSGSTN